MEIKQICELTLGTDNTLGKIKHDYEYTNEQFLFLQDLKL
jgi:hypothetical protein